MKSRLQFLLLQLDDVDTHVYPVCKKKDKHDDTVHFNALTRYSTRTSDYLGGGGGASNITPGGGVSF